MKVTMNGGHVREAQEVSVSAMELEKGDRYIERGETGRVIGRFTVVSDLTICTGDRHNVHVMVTRDGEKGERVACFFRETRVNLIA